MKSYLLIFISLFISVNTYAQGIDETVTLRPKEEKEFFLAANIDDDIDISLERKEGGKLNISLNEYNGELIFTEKKTKKFWSKITSKSKNVYVVKVENPNKKEATFSLKIKVDSDDRIPVKLAYKIVNDTTYGEPTTRLKKIASLDTKSLQNEKFYLNSWSNAVLKRGKDRVVFPIYLPENTEEWYYIFSASRNEKDISNTLNSFSLASELTGIINSKESVSNSVTSLSTPPGADICDVYVLDDSNVELFTKKEDFEYKIDASRENYKSGLIQVKEDYGSKVYLGINNPDNLHGIHVGIEVVAVIKVQKEVEEIYRKPNIISKKVPFVE